jgi:hypothetical protein
MIDNYVYWKGDNSITYILTTVQKTLGKERQHLKNRSSLAMICNRSAFSPGPLVSSTNKTDCHDITEILLKVALNTNKQT